MVQRRREEVDTLLLDGLVWDRRLGFTRIEHRTEGTVELAREDIKRDPKLDHDGVNFVWSGKTEHKTIPCGD